MTTGAGEFNTCVLRAGDVELSTWKEFTVNSHFLTGTDGWTFTLGDEVVTPEIQAQLRPGTKATLLVNGIVQMSGSIDRLRITGNRSSGTQFQIDGRDSFSPVCDSMMKPGTTWPEKTPITDVIKKTLAPFGFATFFADNSENRNAAMGRTVTVSASFDDLSKNLIEHDKPNENEGTFAFLSRLTQRFGYWMWPTVDGTGVIVGAPDYDQAPSFRLIHKLGGSQNNILSWDVVWDSTDQPSFVEARGAIPNRSYTRDVMKVWARNYYAAPSLNENNVELSIGTETVEVVASPVSQINTFASLIARPRYLKDPHSRTIAQLEAFVRRELSLSMRKAFVLTYTVLGFEQDGKPWQVDTVAEIDDDRANVHGAYWILSRTFHRSRSGGTTTELELLPLGVIDFGRIKKDRAQKGKKK